MTRTRSSEVLTIVLAALAGALIGRWVFDLRSISIAVIIAAVASAVTIVLVELIDRDGAEAPTAAPPAAPAPSVPANWWDQPPTAPQPVGPQRRTDEATINLASPSRDSGERWYQCPTCGGFDITRGQGPAHRCSDCGASWNWQPPSPWPRVAIDVKARSGVRR